MNHGAPVAHGENTARKGTALLKAFEKLINLLEIRGQGAG
jgi:hypothetical protein